MTYKNFSFKTDGDGIALITWDSPDKSMNVIDMSVMDEWEAIIERVAGDAAVKGAVLTSGKKTFGAGADLGMIQNMLGQFHAKKAKDPEAAARMLFDGAAKLSVIFRKQETCGKPFVAAINGCLLYTSPSPRDRTRSRMPSSA